MDGQERPQKQRRHGRTTRNDRSSVSWTGGGYSSWVWAGPDVHPESVLSRREILDDGTYSLEPCLATSPDDWRHIQLDIQHRLGEGETLSELPVGVDAKFLQDSTFGGSDQDNRRHRKF